jgi:hypothetical protein
MTDEIRPTRIPVPHRIRHVSREDREDNEEPFRKKLVEALKDDGDDSRSPERKDHGAEEREPEPDEETPLGHNIDLRT